MFGIYVHIPFCRKACHYCNFHFSTSLGNRTRVVDAIAAEIRLTHIPQTGCQSIYFGGGTPSLLHVDEWEIIMKAIKSKTDISNIQEFTVECNPEDIDSDLIENLKQLGVNRVSLGLQSLNELELKAMNRAHSKEQSLTALALLNKEKSITLSVDLIYGTPWKSDDEWQGELDFIKKYSTIKHLSAYALTVEEKTVLAHQVNKNIIPPIDEDKAALQFDILQKHIKEVGWEAYEISNYCAEGYRAIHNSNYWNFLPYYGFGPSAHSYDGDTLRYWNEPNNARYVSAIENHSFPREIEKLTENDRLNEYIMVKLRTKEGIVWSDIELLRMSWRKEKKTMLEHYKSNGWIDIDESGFYLTNKGRLIGDELSANLFES